MTLEIKICGLKTPEAVDAALAGGATHVGFIFFARSPRNIGVEEAAELAKRAREGGAKTVAVTVDADDAYLESIASMMKPDMLQLHGNETPERVKELKQRFGLPVMKAFAIRDATDLAKCVPYLTAADRFLFDAKPPAGSDLPGGNGLAFDWQLLAALDDRHRLHAFRRPRPGKRRRGAGDFPCQRRSTYPRASKAPRASRTSAKSPPS